MNKIDFAFYLFLAFCAGVGFGMYWALAQYINFKEGEEMTKIVIPLLLIAMVGCTGSRPFHKTILVPETEVHIVSDRSMFEHPVNPTATGYQIGNKIYVLGTWFRGKIYVGSFLLGHEFKHILNCIDPEMINPDE